MPDEARMQREATRRQGRGGSEKESWPGTEGARGEKMAAYCVVTRCGAHSPP